MSEIQRYGHDIQWNESEMVPDDEGDYVLYNDHAAVVAEACRVMKLYKAADNAWLDNTTRHDICHEMTKAAQEAAEKFLEEHK
jgi:hypothetical protein